MIHEDLAESRFLVNNDVEKDLKAVLRPLNLMLAPLLYSQYRIYHDRIVPNSFCYNFTGVICMLMFQFIGLYKIILSCFCTNWNSVSIFMFVSNFCDYFIYTIGFMINRWFHIMKSKNNIQLVLQIQYCHKILRIKRENLRNLITRNWVFVIVLYVFYIGFIIYIYFEYPIVSFYGVVATFCVIVFDMNIIYATQLIRLLTETMRIWIMEVKEPRSANTLGVESHWDVMFDVHQKILDAYKMVEKLFNVLIIFYVANSVFHGLLNIEALLTVKKIIIADSTKGLLQTLIPQFWIAKNLAFLVCLSVQCENFSSTINDVYSTCVLLLKTDRCIGSKKRLCKNVKRIHRSSFTEMSGCGLFKINARLPIDLSSYIVNYIIVFLGFAFL